LDKDMIDAIKAMKVGEYSQPMVYTDRLKREVRILYLKSRSEPHRENLTDDYNEIADDALIQKKNEIFQKWLVKRIPSYYIMIDPDYLQCSSLKVWSEYANPESKQLVSQGK